MSESLKLGQIITEKQSRDAVHVAVVPIEASEDVYPGIHIGVTKGKADQYSTEKVGIVDPFLKEMVKKGQKFWLYLYPGSIVSLRHAWSHPAFKDDVVEKKGQSEKEKAEEWMRMLATANSRFTYEDLLETAAKAIQSGRAHAGDDDDQDFLNEHKALLLKNAAIILGIKYDPEQSVYFSCSC